MHFGVEELLEWLGIELVMGQFFVAWVGSGRVGSAIYALGLNLENFP